MLIGQGYEDAALSEEEVRDLVSEATSKINLSDQKVLIIIPDLTRSAPVPQMCSLFRELLEERVAALDFIVALGTHPKLDDDALSQLVGQPVVNGRVGKCQVLNHHWDEPETFVTLGTIDAATLHEVTGGLMARDVPVTVNRKILEYDHLFVCGPTVPHEAVGFSGGNKYFFPGISGPEVIDFTHWLGAVISNVNVIGIVDTPIRRIIDMAAAMIDRPKLCFSMVVRKIAGQAAGLSGLFIGTPEEAFAAAADLSGRVHIEWVEKQYRRVLSLVPKQYDDLWTGSKGIFKLEPIVADGGEIILYAPHINELSYSYGQWFDEFGYHVRDYYLQQWDRFRDYPWLMLAHSAYVKGSGEFRDGVEQPRIRVTLASGIPRERCEQVNLGYRNPATINLHQWQASADNDLLVVPNAGEVLHRVRTKASLTRPHPATVS